MTNKELDKKLGKAIKRAICVPDIVNEKLQKTYEELDVIKENSIEKRKSKKWLSIAASIIVVLFLGGNVMAAVQGQPNLFSFLLEKFNIITEYNQHAQEIGLTKESNQSKITITDAAINEDILIIGYKIETKAELGNQIFMNEEISLKDDLEEINITNLSMADKQNKQVSQKIAENTYMLYQAYFIDNINTLGKDITLNIAVKAIQTYEEGVSNYFTKDVVIGDWKFNIDIKKDQDNAQEYAINNCQIALKNGAVLEVVNVKSTELASIVTTYVTKNSDNFLTIEIKDKSGTILTQKDSQKIDSFITRLLTKKWNEEEEYTISVYEKGTEQILGSKTILLKKDGEKPKQIPDVENQTIVVGDLTASFPTAWKIITQQKDNLVVQINRYYNNTRFEIDSNLRIQSKMNTKKLSLDEIAKEVKLEAEMNTSLSNENYFIYSNVTKQYVLVDKKDYDNEKSNKFVLTQQETKDIIQGTRTNIVKNNKTVTKADLTDIVRQGFEVNKEEKVMLGNQQAIKLTIKTYGTIETFYILLVQDTIYQIQYDAGSAYINSIEKAISEIKIK